MDEPIRPERRAAAGEFCIWIEPIDGTPFCCRTGFNDIENAVGEARGIASGNEWKDRFCRLIVYDDTGWFKHIWHGQRRTHGPAREM